MTESIHLLLNPRSDKRALLTDPIRSATLPAGEPGGTDQVPAWTEMDGSDGGRAAILGERGHRGRFDPQARCGVHGEVAGSRARRIVELPGVGGVAGVIGEDPREVAGERSEGRFGRWIGRLLRQGDQVPA